VKLVWVFAAPKGLARKNVLSSLHGFDFAQPTLAEKFKIQKAVAHAQRAPQPFGFWFLLYLAN